MRIIHTSDWHIRDRDIEEQGKCLQFLVETAQKEQPDLIVHAGDVLDQRGVQLDTEAVKLVFQTFSELAGIAPVAVIIGTPSHEGAATEVLSHIKARYPVHVSTHPEQLYLCEGDLHPDPVELFCPDQAPIDAVISMVPAPTKQFFAHNSDIKTSDMEIAGEMSKMFAGFAAQAEAYVAPHILVGHWNITGSLVSETQTLTGVDIELSRDQMALSNASLKLMGHIHKSQQIGKDIFFPGSITGLTWGELDDKGFYIHEISTDAWIPSTAGWPFISRFIKTPSRKLVKLSKDFTGMWANGGIDSIDTIITTESEVKNAHIKLEIKVHQDEAQKIDKEEIKKALIDMGAKSVGIHLLRMPRENVRSKSILKLTTLREKVIEWANLRGETVPDSILEKADLLESEAADKIIQEVAAS